MNSSARRRGRQRNKYSGTVTLLADGEPVASMVASLWKDAGPPVDWGGELRPANHGFVPIDPGEYVVRLEDGTEARLIVERATMSASDGVINQELQVLGNGAPPF